MLDRHAEPMPDWCYVMRWNSRDDIVAIIKTLRSIVRESHLIAPWYKLSCCFVLKMKWLLMVDLLSLLNPRQIPPPGTYDPTVNRSFGVPKSTRREDEPFAKAPPANRMVSTTVREHVVAFCFMKSTVKLSFNLFSFHSWKMMIVQTWIWLMLSAKLKAVADYLN